MKSIAQSAIGGQAKKGTEVYPFGMHIPSPLKGVPRERKDGQGIGAKRGEIETFSAAARRRMRYAMLTKHIPGGLMVGVTFTVPWKGDKFEPLMDEFRDCWNRMCVAFRRRFKKSAMIYRVELQVVGRPHIHAILWLDERSACDLVPGCACVPRHEVAAPVLQFTLGAMWRAAVKDLHHGSFSGFIKRGVKVDAIRDAGAMFRYLADHASKHKQAQLGYKGKQWGIIGRDNLVERDCCHLPRFDSVLHCFIFHRLLRRVMRYRLQASRHHWKRLPPFGSVLKGSRRTVGDFYLRQDTALRMFEHARQLALDKESTRHLEDLSPSWVGASESAAVLEGLPA